MKTRTVARRSSVAVHDGHFITYNCRVGKETATTRAGSEKKTLVTNMTGTCKAVQTCSVLVRLLLSVLLVNSRQLIDHMMRVWMVHGSLDNNQPEAEEGCTFILEFSEDGDRQHGIKGRP
ncbi:hypothetical protein D1007_39175 [Hordeum vulgare]|nr:hypothetical protein D1007_39175 [Hordeum vulgare]